MTLQDAHPELAPDPATALRAMIRDVAIALLLAAGAIALILALLGRGDWWSGFVAATALSVMAAATSIGAMRVGMGFGMQGAIAGHFGGMALRLLIVLGGGILLVTAGDYPAAATLTLAIPYYFATLAGETVALARILRPTYMVQEQGRRETRE
jgi:hypothetical protein